MTTNQWLIDALCEYLFENPRIHSDKVGDQLLRDTVVCGLIRAIGNGWYVLTEYGRDHVVQMRDDERDFYGWVS